MISLLSNLQSIQVSAMLPSGRQPAYTRRLGFWDLVRISLVIEERLKSSLTLSLELRRARRRLLLDCIRSADSNLGRSFRLALQPRKTHIGWNTKRVAVLLQKKLTSGRPRDHLSALMDQALVPCLWLHRRCSHIKVEQGSIIQTNQPSRISGTHSDVSSSFPGPPFLQVAAAKVYKFGREGGGWRD